jgi:hypothetical protein
VVADEGDLAVERETVVPPEVAGPAALAAADTAIHQTGGELALRQAEPLLHGGEVDPAIVEDIKPRVYQEADGRRKRCSRSIPGGVGRETLFYSGKPGGVVPGIRESGLPVRDKDAVARFCRCREGVDGNRLPLAPREVSLHEGLIGGERDV